MKQEDFIDDAFLKKFKDGKEFMSASARLKRVLI